jgi:hypothetical protein
MIEDIIADARQYTSVARWRDSNSVYYSKAKNMRAVRDLFGVAHCNPQADVSVQGITTADIDACLKECKTFMEFIKKHNSVYHLARRHGILEYCKNYFLMLGGAV